ncbi:MAG TPA: nucleotidyltransferase family protein [Terriglobales bacterium]|nr:nucleotidyltransferase family protein [Terriglobales bacterium]
MKNQNLSEDRYSLLLSKILLGKPSDYVSTPDFTSVFSSPEETAAFIAFANVHHVIVRAIEELLKNGSLAGNEAAIQLVTAGLAEEKQRVSAAVSFLEKITQKLDANGCPAVVIKSLDHHPDLGSDLDLFSSGDEPKVITTMKAEFGAEVMGRSWGDRIAHKWNFRIPGLSEAVEIHVGVLGQTGEHLNLAKQVIQNAVVREIEGHTFRVAAPEERIMISTLQRMYRHFYFRLCDIIDSKTLINAGQLDFDRLRKAAEPNGIWPGVATYLQVVQEYARKYGTEVTLPEEVLSSAKSSDHGLPLKGHFLRIPIVPDATGLFFRQMAHAGSKADLRTMARLTVLPGLAAAAMVSYKITGDDKGIW